MYIFKPIIAWIIAQLIKVIIEGWQNKKVDFKRLTGSGGMPSSHAAMAVALTSSLWKDFGPQEPVVAVASIFTLIVLYDATGVRRAAGEQAAVLNVIIVELKKHSRPLQVEERMKELIGHTPLQVLMGALLGFFVGYYL